MQTMDDSLLAVNCGARLVGRVRGRLNALVFTQTLLGSLWLAPALVAAPLLTFQLYLGRSFPLLAALSVSSLLPLAWALHRMRRRGFSSEEARSFVDSWLGGRGEALTHAWQGAGAERLPRLGLRTGLALRKALPALLFLGFLAVVPVVKPLAPPLAPETGVIAERLLGLEETPLQAEIKEELKVALERLQNDAGNMSSEEFWREADECQKRLEGALSESASGLSSAAGEVAQLAGNADSGQLAGVEDGQAAGGLKPGSSAAKALENLAAALKTLAQNPACGLGPGLDPALAAKLSELAKLAQASGSAALAQSLRSLSPDELKKLAESLERAAQACRSAKGGKACASCSLAGLGECAGEMCAAALQSGRGAGRGGVSRGPGTDPDLFGAPAKELAHELQDALLPAPDAREPGVFLGETSVTAEPKVEKGQAPATASPGPVLGSEREALSGGAKIPPRYQRTLRRYFSPGQP